MKIILLTFACALLLALPARAEMSGMTMMGPGEGHGQMETGGMDMMAERMSTRTVPTISAKRGNLLEHISCLGGFFHFKG